MKNVSKIVKDNDIESVQLIWCFGTELGGWWCTIIFLCALCPQTVICTVETVNAMGPGGKFAKSLKGICGNDI